MLNDLFSNHFLIVFVIADGLLHLYFCKALIEWSVLIGSIPVLRKQEKGWNDANHKLGFHWQQKKIGFHIDWQSKVIY
jgi:hypothetical protein